MNQFEKEKAQTVLEQKAILIKHFLDEAVDCFGEKNFQEALEQCIVIITLVREMIVVVNRERFRQREAITLEEAQRKVPPRHVMWYELKEKYLPQIPCKTILDNVCNTKTEDVIDVDYFPSIEELDLSVRSNNCLRRGGIETVGDLITKTSSELMQIRNLGKTCMEEIVARLAEFGYSLREEE